MPDPSRRAERPEAGVRGEQSFRDFVEGVIGGRRSTGFSMAGDDVDAEIALSLEAAHRGGRHTLALERADGEATIEVTMPAGAREGTIVRLIGQGEPGLGKGPAGDLLLHVRLERHPVFQVVGVDDIQADLPVAPWEAALGASVRATLPDGAVDVRVPEGTQTGRKLRLKGRGIPGNSPGGQSGDLYLVLEVVLPPANTPKARELYQTMARELAFDPRHAEGAKT
jgi:curved DNA-binding protein